MRFDSIESLKSEGFEGFRPISSLVSTEGRKVIPAERGVYLVLYLGRGRPNFLETGTGGRHHRPPNTDTYVLREQWIEGTIVIYIGQAGCKTNGERSNSNLRKRLSKYMRYGQGRGVAHEGGRNIWQIENCHELFVCWKTLPNRGRKPKEVEGALIKEFKDQYGDWPFANHQD